MEATAPLIDFDTCIEHGKYFAQKIRDQDILIKKSVFEKDTILYTKLVKEKEGFHRELIIYGKLGNYLKNLKKFQ